MGGGREGCEVEGCEVEGCEVEGCEKEGYAEEWEEEHADGKVKGYEDICDEEENDGHKEEDENCCMDEDYVHHVRACPLHMILLLYSSVPGVLIIVDPDWYWGVYQYLLVWRKKEG